LFAFHRCTQLKRTAHSDWDLANPIRGAMRVSSKPLARRTLRVDRYADVI